MRAITPIQERFWAKVSRNGPVPSHAPELGACWIWIGAISKAGHGYGHLGRGRRGEGHIHAHRLSWVIRNGAIPADLELDHLCRNPRCVNPCHLEPVTHKTNLLRGQSFSAKNSVKTHCSRGHEFNAVNTRAWQRKDGSVRRLCRACDRERHRERAQMRRERGLEAR